MRALFLLGIFAALAAFSAEGEKAPDVAGSARATYEDEVARGLRDRLVSDPDAVDALTGRILQSRITELITDTQDERQAYRDVRAWVLKNPLDAAHLAVGFAKDDAEHSSEFETSLFSRVRSRFELNPDRYKGIYGKLHGVADTSRSMKLEEKLTEEQRRDLIKNFFEGEAGELGQLQGGPAPGAPGAPGGPQAAVPPLRPKGLYERLSADNPTAFSPKILALQNELNRSQVPGAPKLVESGKLDYATLRHPFYGLSYDIERLREALADGRGRPERAKLVEQAAFALRRFDREASKAVKPSGITAERLRNLSALHRETARWITAAAFAERAALLEACRGFLSPAVESAVHKAPVDAETRKRYLSRGEKLNAELEGAIRGARRAVELLRKEPGSAELAELEELDRAARRDVKRLPRLTAVYAEVPQRLQQAVRSTPEAGGWLARARLKLFPKSDYARGVRASIDKQTGLVREFRRIAARG